MTPRDDASSYEMDEVGYLKRRPNGACIYLGETGCTIYERRPEMCRIFHCGEWFRSTTRANRRAGLAVAENDQYGRMVAEGRKRANR